MASWMLRGRSLRCGRPVRSRHDSEDDVQLDMSKDASECAREILTNICKRQGLTDGKRFGYLNAFVKLLTQTDIGAGDLGYTIEDIQCCLRVTMVHESSLVRAATLRTLRYLLKEERDVKTLIRLQYPHLIARSLDINLRNDMERVQVLRLMRRMLMMCPANFPPSLVRCLVAMVIGGPEEKDRLLRATLAVLAETCVLNPEVFLECGGVSAVTHSILDAQMPRIVECLCGALLFLLNHPRTRAQAGVQLQSLASPYCDFHWSGEKEVREQRFHCCRLALLSVLRSWPGVLHFCHPDNTSGLQAVISVLYLRQLEVRKGILDLLYDLLGLPQPEWTDEYSVALDAVDPSRPRDSWRLSEGFIAAEGKDVLPNLAKSVPNIVEIHLAVLLYVFLENGLLEALVEVSVSSDTFISVRATVLLGELLQLTHQLLPPECCNLTPPLPGLLAHAANEKDLASQHQALAAVSALSRLHQLHKRRPAPASLFLDFALQGGSWSRPCVTPGPGPGSGESHKGRNKLYQFIMKEGSDDVLKDSGVLAHKDGFSWNWNVVRAVLKSRSDALKKLEDSNYRLFFKRLVHYFKPSSNRFSRVELGNKRQTQMYTLAGCELVDCLLDSEEVEGGKLLAELLGDISVQIDAILTSKSAHDCFFSPQHVTSSVCQDYFLFIGRLCRTPRGSRALDKAGIFQQLMNLVVSTNHDCYMKLVISGLDYSMDGMPRVILSKLLTVPSESSRLYATQYLLVLLRAKLPDFHKWGVELLVNQLYDKSKAISLAALTILGEATHEKMYLDGIIALRPSLLHLGDKGLLLLITFLSTPAGFTFLQDANFVTNELERWRTNFNYRYVRLVEGEIHDSFTLHQRGDDGRYSRRVTNAKHTIHDVFVPPHLYGQLVQHDKGFQLLLKEGHLDNQFQAVLGQRCGTEQEILELKAALWCCGHVGTAPGGVALLAEEGIMAAVVRLVETCPVYTVRGTALYVLGLLATTPQGANELQHAGWLCVRHNRHVRWPVIEDEPCVEDAEGKEESSFGTETDNLSLSSGTESDCKQVLHGGRHFYIPDGEEESIGSADDEGLLLDEASESARWVDVPGRKSSLPHQRKSQTLPHARQGRGLSAPRHIRSLSESKQPHMAPSPSPGQHSLDWPSFSRSKESAAYSPGGLVVTRAEETKSRSNSCTDSSGVSSCDSTVGKHAATTERVQTLSPIPSSTSLNTLRSPAPDVMDKLRKLSLQSCSPSEGLVGTPDAMSSRLSQQDLLGYATLRSLHQNRRPLFSDTSSLAAVELLGFDDHGLAAVNAARANKIRSLDRHFTNPVTCEFEATFPPQLFSGASSAGLTAKTYIGSRTNIFSRLSGSGGSDQNCYMGIALPRRLSSLFPCETAVPVPSAEERKRSDRGTSFNEMEQVQEVVEDLGETTSSDTEDTDEGRRGRENISAGRYKHSAVHCLTCCRLRDRKTSAGSYHRYRTDTESSYGGADSPIVTLRRRNKSQSTCNGLMGTTSAGSMDSANSLDAGPLLMMEEEGTLLSKTLARKQIMKHISRMSNPVWCKQSKQALLQLKQKNPSAFQDVCLYSEVCYRMGSSTYRLVARKFIQELFLDLDFDSLYDEPTSILQLQKPVETAVTTASTSASPGINASCTVTFLPTLCVTSSPPLLPTARTQQADSQVLEVVHEETPGPSLGPVPSATGVAVRGTCYGGGAGVCETSAVKVSEKLASVPTNMAHTVASNATTSLSCTNVNKSVLVIGNAAEASSHMSHLPEPKIVLCQPVTGIENLNSITSADKDESVSDCTLSTPNSARFVNKTAVLENNIKLVNCVKTSSHVSRTRPEQLFATSMENNVPSIVASRNDLETWTSDSSRSKTSSRHLPVKPSTAKAAGICARQRKLATASPPNISTLAKTLSHPVPALTSVSKTEENGRQKPNDSLSGLNSANVSECKKL